MAQSPPPGGWHPADPDRTDRIGWHPADPDRTDRIGWHPADPDRTDRIEALPTEALPTEYLSDGGTSGEYLSDGALSTDAFPVRAVGSDLGSTHPVPDFVPTRRVDPGRFSTRRASDPAAFGASGAETIPAGGAETIPAGGAETIPAGGAETIPAGGAAETIPAGAAETIPAGGGATAPAGEVRFGPGVPMAPTGWPRPPAAPPRRRRSPARVAASVLSTVLTLALVGAVGIYLWQRLQPLEIVSVTAAVPQPPGRTCDTTVDVVATVRTNGNAGTIGYQWFRSGAEPSGVLTERVARGQRTVSLHLAWAFSGTGTTTQTATVNVVSPSPAQASTEVTYSCG
ncbi:hypothetical protein [Plantactinospora sp. GCM10030261]|uniref:hypothetical protein n=1 Tax=Plantactinospora sp. GCM10030261 TaxID=3273420 RepID=UPI0036113888